jgi:hypothetical protein
MREFTVGAIAGLCAYGAAWWSALDAPVRVEANASAEVAPKPRRAAERRLPEPPAVQRDAAPAAVTTVPRDKRGIVAAAPPPMPAATSEHSLPPEALPASLRRLAEFRREGETPEELVKRVESFELSPEELAQFRRVANQLFEMPTNSMERQASPWGAQGRRSGGLTEPR